MSKIIVGVEYSERSKDATALAAQLARATGAELVLTCAYPFAVTPSRVGAGDAWRRHLREEAEAATSEAEAGLFGLPLVTRRTIAETSAANCLQTVATHEGASLIVLGSSHRGGAGRVLAGTTAERLLHGAPCPVVVAPGGYRRHAEDTIASIGVAYDGSEEAKAALAGAVTLARALGARLEVIRVLDTVMLAVPGLMTGPRYELPDEEIAAQARGRLSEVVATLPQDLSVEPVLRVGEPERELAERSEAVDLMVVGSRGYGPHRAVLLGSVSGRLTRDAACPVLVVPRGIEAPLEELLSASEVSG